VAASWLLPFLAASTGYSIWNDQLRFAASWVRLRSGTPVPRATIRKELVARRSLASIWVWMFTAGR
jgi:hypothetical protein